jgi:hypothetical protein
MAINVVTAGSGLTGGGSGNSITLSIANGGIIHSMLAADAVWDSNIATGQVVKSFNGLTDSVVLAAGYNITITPSGNTVMLSSLTTMDATLPLVLHTPDYGATIQGTVTITPAHNGGAVALQTGTPVYQTGFAALDDIYIPSTGSIAIGVASATAFIDIENDATNSRDYVKLSDYENNNILHLTKEGRITLGVNAFSYLPDAGEGPLAYFNVPLDCHDTLALYKNLIGATTTVPLFDLTPNSIDIPLINSEATTPSALVIKSSDDSSVVNTTLDSDGKLFTRQVKADSFIVGTQEQTVGAVPLHFNDGPSFFACDAVGGVITFTLPELTADSPSGYEYSFKKIDASSHPVMVSASGSQSIDGVTDKLITTRWGSLKLVSIVSGSSGYWLSL